MGRRRRSAALAALVAVAACTTLVDGPTAADDPAPRVAVTALARDTYSIRPVTHSCLTRPQAGRRERLIALAEGAWSHFGRQERTAISEEPNPDAGAESDAAIAGFWTAVPDDPGGNWIENLWRRWRDDPGSARAEPWSAAFTSWLMCEAGFSRAEFARSMRHIDYVLHARPPNRFAAHRVHTLADVRPAPGDLLCANKSDEVHALDELQRGYGLHCFLVTSVTEAEAQLVGGNVDGRVVRIRTPLSGNGANARILRRADARWLLLLRLHPRY